MDIAGERIVRLRKKLKLTQREFAEKIGYSRSYLRDIETGKTKASRRFLEAIHGSMGISFDKLVVEGLGNEIDCIVMAEGFESYFIFLYAFTNEGLVEAEEKLMKFLSDTEHIIVDAEKTNTYLGLLSFLVGEKCNGNNVYARYDDFCLEKDRFLVIKNLSTSKIRGKGLSLRELVKNSFGQVVIILDKPSFLEKYASELYYYARTLNVP